MTDAMLRRRDFAAAALLALSPLLSGQANAKLKIVSGGMKPSSGSTSTSTTTTAIPSSPPKTSTSTTTTTTTATNASTKATSGGLSSDTCTYCSPVVDTHARTTFANRSWGLQRDTSKSYAIEQSADLTLKRHRFEVRSGDTWNNEAGRNRAEYSCTAKESNGRDIWFSYAMRVKSGTQITSKWNILGQFHNTPDPGEPSLSPPFAFNLLPGNRLRALKRTNANPLTETSPDDVTLCERPITFDQWHQFVGRIVFGCANNGACELWMDGVKIVNLPVTSIGYNDLVGPYWKFGIYRAAAAETLVVEYANMEIGSTSLLSRVSSPLAIL